MLTNATDFKIVQDLSVLYELALSIGVSGDVRENCESFLNVLMSRKNLSFAGYWLCEDIDRKTPELIYALPFKNFTPGNVTFSPEFKAFLKKERTSIVAKGHDFLEHIQRLTNTTTGEYLVYNTDNSGVLILHRNSSPFSLYEMKQLHKVVSKFGLFIKSLIVQQRTLMRENLLKEQVTAQLYKSENKYQKLFDHTFDAVFNYDSETKQINHYNQAFRQIFRLGDQEVTEIADIMPAYQPGGESSCAYVRTYRDSLEQGAQAARFNFLHKRIDGEVFESETTIITDAKDEKQLIVIVKDLTELRKKQYELAKSLETLNAKNEELQHYIDSNEALENFAYMASHDLQAPLRTVISFTQMLKRSIEPMSDQQEEYVDFIVNASQNMQQLIRDLLVYSKVDADKNTAITKLNVENMVKTIISELKVNIEEKSAILEVAGLPTNIQGNPTRLRQLFQNLISNALKFVKSDVQPKITISAEEQESHWKFYINDNGIGIKPEYQSKIFQLFQRLHTKEEYEGTGIGLAMCQKIVEQHEGNIGIESEFGKGSTFYFTIQKDLQNFAGNTTDKTTL